MIVEGILSLTVYPPDASPSGPKSVAAKTVKRTRSIYSGTLFHVVRDRRTRYHACHLVAQKARLVRSTRECSITLSYFDDLTLFSRDRLA